MWKSGNIDLVVCRAFAYQLIWSVFNLLQGPFPKCYSSIKVKARHTWIFGGLWVRSCENLYKKPWMKQSFSTCLYKTDAYPGPPLWRSLSQDASSIHSWASQNSFPHCLVSGKTVPLPCAISRGLNNRKQGLLTMQKENNIVLLSLFSRKIYLAVSNQW